MAYEYTIPKEILTLCHDININPLSKLPSPPPPSLPSYLDHLSQSQSPSSSTPSLCGYIFLPNDIAWTCLTCQTDPTCVLCNKCFTSNGAGERHTSLGHEVVFHTTMGGGTCDCGDREAWDGAPNANTTSSESDRARARARLGGCGEHLCCPGRSAEGGSGEIDGETVDSPTIAQQGTTTGTTTGITPRMEAVIDACLDKTLSTILDSTVVGYRFDTAFDFSSRRNLLSSGTAAGTAAGRRYAAAASVQALELT